MSRFLFASQPITGHVLPARPLVQTLVEQGHMVRGYWRCASSARPAMR